jgi:hypothetical protein
MQCTLLGNVGVVFIQKRERDMSEISDNSAPLPYDNAAVLQHMAMYQNIISRMANNQG